MIDPAVWTAIRRSRSLVTVAAVAGLLGLISLVPPILSIRTDSIAPTFATGDWFLADLGSALPAAMIIILAGLVIGVVAAVAERGWGYGVIAVVGLAMIGWSLLVLGLAEGPISDVYDALAVPAAEPYSVTVSRRPGYALVVVDALAGLALVGLTIAHLVRRSGRDRRASALGRDAADPTA